MSLEQRNADFCNAQTDAQMAYIEAEREVNKLKAENAKLRAEQDYLLMNSNPTAAELRRVRRAWKNDRDENAKLRELCADLYAEMITYSDAPNYNASVWAPKLRELGIEVDG